MFQSKPAAHSHELHQHRSAALPQGQLPCEHCGMLHIAACSRIRTADFEWHQDESGAWHRYLTHVEYDPAISAELWHVACDVEEPAHGD